MKESIGIKRRRKEANRNLACEGVIAGKVQKQ
jgi:hypothetical protein